jgi:hypothetical protein
MTKKKASKKKTRAKIGKPATRIAKKRTSKKKAKVIPKSREEVRAEKAQQAEPTWPWPLRPYQQAAVDKYDAGIKRQVLAWHRRAGKDVFCLSLARRESRRRVGGYVHFFPKHIQARRAIWQGIDPKKGAPFIDIAFGDYEAARNNTEMFLEMYNGSTWQLLGSDNYDRVVGSNAVGVVFSEWALCDPRAWDFIRPIILENDGFAIFISTFRGRNHMWQMTQQLADNPQWYVDVRDITRTQDIDGNPILTEADMQAERDSGMSEALLQQEYYCNPEAVAEGAIYGRQVERLRKEVDRHHAAWNPNKPVYCVWNIDLPIFASCITVQPGNPPQILDAQTWNFTTLGEALRNSEQQKWPVMSHIIRAEQRELVNQFQDMQRHPTIVQGMNTFTQTTATSNFLEQCHIDTERCELLLDALSGYVRRERFDAQVADMQYSDQAAASWHQQLAVALETWAVWDYYSQGNQWASEPDYTIQDRIARTIL